MPTAKFVVEDVVDTFADEQKKTRIAQNVSMRPVYGTDPGDENTTFWNATPAGSIQLFITNNAVFGQFQAGREYYVEFRPAPDTT